MAISNLEQIQHYQSYKKYDCCRIPEVVQDNGFNVCKNCGIVHDRIIEKNPQRVFNEQQVRDKKITEPVYRSIGPRTVIRGNRDARGSKMNYLHQRKFHRLGKINRSLITSFERNLWIALPHFSLLRNKLSLPRAVVEDAIRIYKKAVKRKMALGRSIDILLAASIYVALKMHKIPMVVEEITQELNVDKKPVLRCFRVIVLELLSDLNIQITHLGPKRYISRFSSELNLPQKVSRDAIKLLYKLKKERYFMKGKDPKGIAAGCIYIMCKHHDIYRTQKAIAEKLHVTCITLRLRSKEMLKALHKAKSTSQK